MYHDRWLFEATFVIFQNIYSQNMLKIFENTSTPQQNIVLLCNNIIQKQEKNFLPHFVKQKQSFTPFKLNLHFYENCKL